MRLEESRAEKKTYFRSIASAWLGGALFRILSSHWLVKQGLGSKELKSFSLRTLGAPRSKAGNRLSFQDNSYLFLPKTRDWTLLLPCSTLVKTWRNLPLNAVSFLFSRKLCLILKCCVRSPPSIFELLKKASVIIYVLNSPSPSFLFSYRDVVLIPQQLSSLLWAKREGNNSQTLSHTLFLEDQK